MSTTAKLFMFKDGNEKEHVIRVSASFDKEVNVRNCFNVYISCNGITLRTKFHDSASNYKKGKVTVDDQLLFDCLHHILNEAYTVFEDLGYFYFKELYDRTFFEYRKCQSYFKKFIEMFDNDYDTFLEILNNINNE